MEVFAHLVQALLFVAMDRKGKYALELFRH